MRITITGDLMCKGAQARLLYDSFGSYSFENCFDECGCLFGSSDYLIGNLETPVCECERETKSAISFNTPIEFLTALKSTGFDFLSLANNHCLDCGVEGLMQTLRNVKRIGFDCDGAYDSKERSEDVFIKEIKGIRLAIVTSTFGTNSESNGVMLADSELWRVSLLHSQLKPRKWLKPIDNDVMKDNPIYIADGISPAAISNLKNEIFLRNIARKVARAKSVADIVIAMPHVGGQYNPGPAGYTKYVVRRLVEAGADVVIAGHPHVVHRCAPWRKDEAFVAFSLGNFCTTPGVGWYVPNTLGEYGVVLHLNIDEKLKRLAHVTFSVVKNQVDDVGISHVRPVDRILADVQNMSSKDRLIMEVEAVVNRFCGRGNDVSVQCEYEFWEDR